MGFWTNWKEKRKDKKPIVAEDAPKTSPESSKKKKKEATVASALEENENQKYHRKVVENVDSEIAKTQQQPIDDLIEDPHLHSQGFISPKQGVHILVDEVMDKEQPNLQKKKKRPPKHNKLEEKELKKKQKAAAKKAKLEKTMLKSALTFSKDIKKLSKKYKAADNDFFEELEDILVRTDMGMELVLKISQNLQKKIKKNQNFAELKELLVEEIYAAYDPKHHGKTALNYSDQRMNIFMVVGVNGTGKTTSLAKLANYFAGLDQKVMIIAADTFRAGAVEQLEEWVQSRLENNVSLVKGKPGQDPSSVIFDGLKQAQEQNYDLVLIDTAGRIQNKVNLMNELKKMHDIVHKFDKTGPHEVLLTIDATTGQNGTIQAQEFSEVTNVSGIILTKMDGTSKGGIALAIKNKLNIPVKMVGVGEQVDDLVEFNVDDYIYGLVVGFMDENEGEENDES